MDAIPLLHPFLSWPTWDTSYPELLDTVSYHASSSTPRFLLDTLSSSLGFSQLHGIAPYADVTHILINFPLDPYPLLWPMPFDQFFLSISLQLNSINSFLSKVSFPFPHYLKSKPPCASQAQPMSYVQPCSVCHPPCHVPRPDSFLPIPGGGHALDIQSEKWSRFKFKSTLGLTTQMHYPHWLH